MKEGVAFLVQRAIDEYRYEQPVAGTTLGMRWTTDTVEKHIAILKQSIVPPYRQKFLLRETYEQIATGTDQEADYWVVAECDGVLVWFDEATGEFGLGEKAALPDAAAVSVGVRGDIVGVFCAR